MISFLKWQATVAVILIVIAAVWFGEAIAQSVFFGALVTLVPNVFLAVYVFMRATKRTANQVVKACYIGEAMKLALIALMMLFILHTFAVQMGPFLIGLMGTYLVYVFSPVILKKNCS